MILREKLLYAKEDAVQEELEQTCRIASIHEFIAGQPEGYDTMDEATSALDSISENAIQDALETLMAGRASIVIAHPRIDG